jgi:hypothetical protein
MQWRRGEPVQEVGDWPLTEQVGRFFMQGFSVDRAEQGGSDYGGWTVAAYFALAASAPVT